MNELQKLRLDVRNLALDSDEAGLTDEDWYERLWTLLDPVIDARAEQALAVEPEPTRYDWGVAWFSKSSEKGVCARCRKTTRVYQGYNGGAHINKFCADCRGPVYRNEA